MTQPEWLDRRWAVDRLLHLSVNGGSMPVDTQPLKKIYLNPVAIATEAVEIEHWPRSISTASSFDLIATPL